MSVETLEVGAHIHLDEVVGNAPAPGSREWLPIVEELIQLLDSQGGNWTITVPVGTATVVPRKVVSAPDVFHLVDRSDLMEAPAAHRLADTLVANRWEGEYHCWRRVLQNTVAEIVSLSRSSMQIGSGEPYCVEIAFEIRPR